MYTTYINQTPVLKPHVYKGIDLCCIHTLKMVTTPLSAATHVEIAAPPPFLVEQKMCRLAVMFQLVRVSDLKPHVYKGFDLYMLFTHSTNDGNASLCRRSRRNLRAMPTITICPPPFVEI